MFIHKGFNQGNLEKILYIKYLGKESCENPDELINELLDTETKHFIPFNIIESQVDKIPFKRWWFIERRIYDDYIYVLKHLEMYEEDCNSNNDEKGVVCLEYKYKVKELRNGKFLLISKKLLEDRETHRYKVKVKAKVLCPFCKNWIIYEACGIVSKWMVDSSVGVDNTLALACSSHILKKHLAIEHKLKIVKTGELSDETSRTTKSGLTRFIYGINVYEYKCPYCNYKGTLRDIIIHILKNHSNQLPN